MLDRIFHQRLQQHARNHDFQRLRVKLFDHFQFVPSKTDHFNIQIVVDEIDFFLQRYKGVTTVQQPAQDGRQLDNQLARCIGSDPHQR